MDNLFGFLILKDDAEHGAAEPVGEPLVLDYGHLERLAVEGGHEVGVYSATHSLKDDQICLAFLHHLAQIKVGVSE